MHIHKDIRLMNDLKIVLKHSKNKILGVKGLLINLMCWIERERRVEVKVNLLREVQVQNGPLTICLLWV